MDVIERTSAHGLEAYIRGERLAASDVLADRDMLVQIFNRAREEESFIVPAVAEPLLVWIISGNAAVQERELDGDWQCSHVAKGDFFLTTSAQPYEMRWKVDGAEPFEVMHIYLGIPLLDKAIHEVLGGSVEAVRLREVSGGRDDGLSVLLEQVRLELTGHRASPLYLQGWPSASPFTLPAATWTAQRTISCAATRCPLTSCAACCRQWRRIWPGNFISGTWPK